jgi:hypothetical protein
LFDGNGACHNSIMANQPSDAQPATVPNYQLVVSASYHKTKQFVWVIVDDASRAPLFRLPRGHSGLWKMPTTPAKVHWSIGIKRQGGPTHQLI